MEAAEEFTNVKHDSSCLNILILGETGVGKSTFINALANYLKYANVEEAAKQGAEILIPVNFKMQDKDDVFREVICAPTIQIEKSGDSNESSDRNQSGTQAPRSYVFPFNNNKIRIIDTPGIGDTRGVEQDRKNFQSIIKFITEFPSLKAVCILLKPNDCKLTVGFRFCLDELLLHLHRSAAENILFCFTKTRNTFFRVGDSLITLRLHLDKLKERTGINFKLDKSTLFSFESDSFRFLCARKQGLKLSLGSEDFQTSWVKSSQEAIRMFEQISNLEDHIVADTTSINDIRQLVFSLTRPLAEIQHTQMINLELIEEQKTKLEKLLADGKLLKEQLLIEQMVVDVIPLEVPQTVCTGKDCVEYRACGKSKRMVKTYKQICHEDCALQGVKTENCPNTLLQECYAMRDTENCYECGCSWQTHMHIDYKLECKMEMLEDFAIRTSLQKQRNSVTDLRTALLILEEKVEEIEAEMKMVRDSCVVFTSYLCKNSLLPYSDSFGEYIDHIIREEREKDEETQDEKTLNRLLIYKAGYMEEVALMKRADGKQNTQNHTIGDIQKMIRNLKRLKHCRPILEGLEKIEFLSIK